jgi:hypothetical protein
MGRLTKRFIRGNLGGAMATLRGTYAGIRKHR